MDSSRQPPPRRAPLSKRPRQSDVLDRTHAPAAGLRRVGPLGAFRDECDAAINGIRAAVAGLCAEVGVDPFKPQDVSRRLGLNKNLTWKFARILVEADPLDAAPMVPGPEGVAIYLRAFESAGVREPALLELRAAIAGFDAMVDRHFGGRAELDLVLDGLRVGANLEQSRRLAFRGNAAVFGVQAAARVTAQIVAPSTSDEALADVVMIVGLAGLRRLRPIPKLPVFRSMVTSKSTLPPARPLLPGADGLPADFLMREFSSFPNAGVTRTEAEGRLTIELDDGPIGRSGEADLFFGSVLERSYSCRGSAEDRHAQFITSVTIPAESFVSDILVHRSIPGPESVEAAMFGALGGPIPHDAAAREALRIPIDCTPLIIDELAERASAKTLEVANVPNYVPMVERAFAALGARLGDYRLIRVAMAHPPMPASLVVGWSLPE